MAAKVLPIIQRKWNAHEGIFHWGIHPIPPRAWGMGVSLEAQRLNRAAEAYCSRKNYEENNERKKLSSTN